MGKPRIIQFGSLDEPYRRVGDQYASCYQGICEHFGRAARLWEALDTLKYADFVLIWNGAQDNAGLVARMCKRFGIPHAFYEQGVLSQIDTWLVDLQGFCGDSFLCHDIGWVTSEDLKRLHDIRADLQKRFPLNACKTVLVPLQIENDSQIVFHTYWRNMDEFMDLIETMYPEGRVIFRSHPRSTVRRRSRRYPIIDGSAEPFLETARKASVVVGNTSTCLYEAAILGVPVVALGDHPLRENHYRNHDYLCAAMLAMRVEREDSEGIARVLERFGVRPRGVG